MDVENLSISDFGDFGLWQLEMTGYQCQTYDEKDDSVLPLPASPLVFHMSAYLNRSNCWFSVFLVGTSN